MTRGPPALPARRAPPGPSSPGPVKMAVRTQWCQLHRTDPYTCCSCARVVYGTLPGPHFMNFSAAFISHTPTCMSAPSASGARCPLPAPRSLQRKLVVAPKQEDKLPLLRSPPAPSAARKSGRRPCTCSAVGRTGVGIVGACWWDPSRSGATARTCPDDGMGRSTVSTAGGAGSMSQSRPHRRNLHPGPPVARS